MNWKTSFWELVHRFQQTTKGTKRLSLSLMRYWDKSSCWGKCNNRAIGWEKREQRIKHQIQLGGRSQQIWEYFLENVHLSWFQRDHFLLLFFFFFFFLALHFLIVGLIYTSRKKKKKSLVSCCICLQNQSESSAWAVSPKSTLLEKAESCLSFSVSIRCIQCRTWV